MKKVLYICLFIFIGFSFNFIPNSVAALDSCENDICHQHDGQNDAKCVDYSTVPGASDGLDCDAKKDGSDCVLTDCETGEVL